MDRKWHCCNLHCHSCRSIQHREITATRLQALPFVETRVSSCNFEEPPPLEFQATASQVSTKIVTFPVFPGRASNAERPGTRVAFVRTETWRSFAVFVRRFFLKSSDFLRMKRARWRNSVFFDDERVVTLQGCNLQHALFEQEILLKFKFY